MRKLLLVLPFFMATYLKGQSPSDNYPAVVTTDFGLEMILVKGGTFTMGAENITEDERPVHTVTLSDFYISKYEITQAQWLSISDLAEYYEYAVPEYIGMNVPMHNVTWEDVQEYIRWLGVETSEYYRLPTEAEWEYAARGGVISKGYMYAGSDLWADVGWYMENSNSHINPVGIKKPNELGIYDMSGNVWEWCFDYAVPYKDSVQVDPVVLSEGEWGNSRVIRGGGYSTKPVEVFARGCMPEDDYKNDIGFRLVWIPSDGFKAETSGAAGNVPVYDIFEYDIEMVFVEGGEFVMGTSESWASEPMQPHLSRVNDFYICKNEVTQELWMSVMGRKNPSVVKGADLPVHNVSWDDAQEFVEKLNQLTGRKYRLPYESEWEYAAAGGKYKYDYCYAGSNVCSEVAWYYGNSFDCTIVYDKAVKRKYDPYEKGWSISAFYSNEIKKKNEKRLFDDVIGTAVHPVGEKIPNSLGLYDMSGNVSEWCNDKWSPVPESSGIFKRVHRGGSWRSGAIDCHHSSRGSYLQTKRNETIGFRLVLDASESGIKRNAK